MAAERHTKVPSLVLVWFTLDTGYTRGLSRVGGPETGVGSSLTRIADTRRRRTAGSWSPGLPAAGGGEYARPTTRTSGTPVVEWSGTGQLVRRESSGASRTHLGTDSLGLITTSRLAGSNRCRGLTTSTEKPTLTSDATINY